MSTTNANERRATWDLYEHLRNGHDADPRTLAGLVTAHDLGEFHRNLPHPPGQHRHDHDRPSLR